MRGQVHYGKPAGIIAILIPVIILLLAACRENRFPPGVCLSFDDRSVVEWKEMSGLLAKYNAKATFFVTHFDSLTSEEIDILHSFRRDGHEIGSHGALHVLSETFIREHGYEAYLREEIDGSIVHMREAGLEPTSFAYPFGSSYWFTDHLLGNRFKMLRGVAQLPRGTNVDELDEIYYDGNGNKVLALSIDVGADITKEQLNDALNRAQERNEVVLFFAHKPRCGTAEPYTFDPGLLEDLLASATKKGMVWYTVSDLDGL